MTRLLSKLLTGLTAIGTAAVATSSAPLPAPSFACTRCHWAPPASRIVHTARSVAELSVLVDRAAPGTTILIEDGEYRLSQTLDMNVPDVVLRSRSGDPSKVIVRGGGMDDGRVRVAIAIGASRVTLADITIGHAGAHGVQVRGERGVSAIVLHNIRIADTGQQLLKGSSGDGQFASNTLVACSAFEYTTSAPSPYTNGIDVLGGQGWHVRDNRFSRIRGPERDGWKAGPAILFWAGSVDTLVERNVIIDSFRGIAFGLGPDAAPPAYSRPGRARIDHLRGAIRNNVLRNLHPWADEGIEANAALEFAVDFNTVMTAGRLPWSISVRFAESDGKVRNNLTARTITLRDGARAGIAGNVDSGQLDWFADPRGVGFRLMRSGIPPVDAGVALPAVAGDFDQQSRVVGQAPDAGAIEYRGRVQ